jgi:uroporphyrinogen III methyltransferase/synthase
MTGKVYVIGAGPGDSGLITVRGRECLSRAEVVIYDYLVNPDLLECARADAERIYVGKRGGAPSTAQSEINALMIERARAGKIVARLKGGDPFVFGRAAEELLALMEQAIPYEVVPGVTSSLAAPAYAGIPVTHREMASSVHIVTGHEAEGKEGSALDWETLARTKGTLIIMMGMGNLASIAEELIDHGMSQETPTAAIRLGTYPEQQTVTSTLRDIAREIKNSGLEPPAVIVIGECVGLRNTLKWFENKLLFGKRIAVTRPAGQEGDLVAGLRERGARVYVCPTIRIQPRARTPETDRVIESLGEFDWVVFTSKNGVEIFMDRVWALGEDARLFGRSRIAAIGEKTALALNRYGLRADIVPETYSQEGLAEVLNVGWGDRVLLPRAAAARDVLRAEMKRFGAEVLVLDLYDTVGNPEGITQLKELLEQRKLDVVTFTSSSTVEKFMESLKRDERAALFKGVLTASIGSVTSQTLKDCGVGTSLEAKTATFESLIEAMEKQFSRTGA